MPLWEAYNRDWDSDRASIADWVTAQIGRIDKKIRTEYKPEKPEAEPMDETDSTASGWKAHYQAALREVRERNRKPWTPEAHVLDRQEKEKKNLRSQKEYFEEIAALLKAHNAKSWNELFPEKRVVPSTPQASSGHSTHSKQKPEKPSPYKRYASNWYTNEVDKDQVVLYDELYEACWNGDNEKIQELCLPKDPSKVKGPPIQIVAETTEGGNVVSLAQTSYQ